MLFTENREKKTTRRKCSQMENIFLISQKYFRNAALVVKILFYLFGSGVQSFKTTSKCTFYSHSAPVIEQMIRLDWILNQINTKHITDEMSVLGRGIFTVLK